MYNKFLMLCFVFCSFNVGANTSSIHEYKLLNKYNVKITIENSVTDDGEPVCLLKNKDLEEPYYINSYCANIEDPKVVIINNEIMKLITIDFTGKHTYQAFFTIHNEKFTPIGLLID
ncbi:hypothetical protein C5F64_14860 [Photobacterium damselae subsp. damselae]|uniref:hypothetical protein n=1 Tax=Photobacterium damselae TaxID=38293 RepID=UPI00084A9B0D|nr:hypothetical protein [Photobacterium damselae]OEC82224.1 hypothetical protein A9D46_15430 [Photobacterium damselae subsp. damselae]PSB83231.1 hypothetical protein C5F64_14860 [Photobacterium damselae subsp. damselae]